VRVILVISSTMRVSFAKDGKIQLGACTMVFKRVQLWVNENKKLVFENDSKIVTPFTCRPCW
jgi:hypothetical protein